jgi:hypothetical protein
MLMSGGTPFISMETQKQFVQADRLLLCFGSGTSEFCYLTSIMDKVSISNSPQMNTNKHRFKPYFLPKTTQNPFHLCLSVVKNPYPLFTLLKLCLAIVQDR